MLKWLQWWVNFSFQHISSILLASGDHSGSGTREWILILRTRHCTLPNSPRNFWSMWRLYTVPNIDVCWSLYLQAYQATIPSPLQRLQDPVNHPLIHMNTPVMMRKTYHVKMWLKRHPAQEITCHANWLRPGFIWIQHLNCLRTGGNLILMSVITTPTQWRLAVHFQYQISPTGWCDKRSHSQSSLISPMLHVINSLSYHIVLQWRPVFALGEMWLAGGSQKPHAWPLTKKSRSGCMLEPITRYR